MTNIQNESKAKTANSNHNTVISIIAVVMLILVSILILSLSGILSGKDEYSYTGNDKDIKNIEKMARDGDVRSMTELGEFYYLGDCVDYHKAVYWYEKAAEAGGAKEMYDIGFLYYCGKKEIRNYSKAAYWFRKAADKGMAPAMRCMGLIYESGDGVTKNYDQAFYWYNRAAMYDDPDAMVLLGNCYRLGQGIEKNYDKAFHWYKMAAKKDVDYGTFYVGFFYYMGYCVSQDYDEAVSLFMKAAEEGNPSALEYLAKCYENGDGVERDHEKAKNLKAAADEAYDCNKRMAVSLFYNVFPDLNPVKQVEKKIDVDLTGEWESHDSKFPLWLTLSHDLASGNVIVKQCWILRNESWDNAKAYVEDGKLRIKQDETDGVMIDLTLSVEDKNTLTGECMATGICAYSGHLTLTRKQTDNAKYFLDHRGWTSYEFSSSSSSDGIPCNERLVLQFRGGPYMMVLKYSVQDDIRFSGDYSTDGYNISICIDDDNYYQGWSIPKSFKGTFSKDMKTLTLRNIIDRRKVVLRLNEKIADPF